MIHMNEMNVFLICMMAGGVLCGIVGAVMYDELVLALGFGFGIPGAVQYAINNYSKKARKTNKGYESAYDW